MAALHDAPVIQFVDIDPTLNGSDYGQHVFDRYTQKLPAFDTHSMQVFTGIGYVFTQAKDVLPFDMVEGSYHEIYNPDPAHGPKQKLYMGKYALEDYFATKDPSATKEFTKYPTCKHVIICDWNKRSIQMILDILEAAPRAFTGQTITVVHGNILLETTIATLREISETQRIPISAVYLTNIVNGFTPELINLFKPISASDVVLICDDMGDEMHTQLQFHTHPRGRSEFRKPRSGSRKPRSGSRKSRSGSRSRSRDKAGGFTKRYRR